MANENVFRNYVPQLSYLKQNIGTRAENAQPLSLTNATGRTFHEVYSVEVGFDAVRFMFANSQTTGTYTIGPVKCLAIDDISTDQNQNAATWVNVTFGGSTTYVAANATDASNPVIFFSDWIPLSSLARINDPSGKNYPVVLVRSYFPSTTANVTSNGPGIAHPASGISTPDGRVYLQRSQGAVDGVTTLTNFTQTSNGGNGGTLGVQYSARANLTQIYAFGDSITAGQKGLDPQYGWTPRLKDSLSTTANPVEVANFGWPGQTTTQYSARANYLIPQLSKGIVIYPPFSPNDTTTLTQTSINLQLSNLSNVLRTVFANNSYPVLWTSFPYANNILTTTSASAVGVGAVTITPSSMSGISNNTNIMLDSNNSQEFVVASNVTGTTFDCVTTKSHAASFKMYPHTDTVSAFTNKDNFRQALTATLKSFPNTTVVSMESLGNGATPEFWASTFDTYEGLHPVDSGFVKITSLMSLSISNLIGD